LVDKPDRLIQLRELAAVVTGLADQQEHKLASIASPPQQPCRICHRVENRCAVIARVEVIKSPFDLLGIAGEVVYEVQLAVEEK